jgi:5-methyltetrahydrofolate--homocysteine methyltransferase
LDEHRGASNISFGLPDRPGLNAAFIAMAIGAGMTCAITNPLETEIRRAILAADVMVGHDENCASWINYGREAQAARPASATAPAPQAPRQRPRPRATSPETAG